MLAAEIDEAKVFEMMLVSSGVKPSPNNRIESRGIALYYADGPGERGGLP